MAKRTNIVRIHAAETADGGVEISVSDTGRSMSADEAAHAAEAFGKREGGLGLGLALVGDVTREHGGDLAIESELGIGTAVTITVPARRSAHV